MIESYTECLEKPADTSNYLLTDREELFKQQRFGDFASFILSEVDHQVTTGKAPTDC